MKKTLIVSYTPRDNSYTKRLVDFFIEKNDKKTEITFLDLTEDTPDLLLKENLNLYISRNFGGVTLTEEQQIILSKNDKMMNQLLDTDYVVLASPMYNMSLPATVKAWFDGVIQVGKTIAPTAEGIKGLCENKQALVLMSSGSDFNVEPLKNLNFATPLITACFGLMGIPTEAVNVFGSQQYADKYEEMLEASKKEIELVNKRWY